MKVNTAEKLFSSTSNIITFDLEDINASKEIFNSYIESGVIKPNTEYEDNVWQTTDEYSNVGLHFKFNKTSYNKYYKKSLKIPYDSFLLYVKTYLLSFFGDKALNGIQRLLLDLRRLVNVDIRNTENLQGEIKVSSPLQCLDFFSMLPFSGESKEINSLCTALENYAEELFEGVNSKQRTLADFDSYFLFDEIIKDYWASNIALEDRMFYYPLYLWWTLTAVIPLRPREFILTERNCIKRESDGTFHLKLRRNNIKGSNKKVSYNVEDDYFTTIYRIPEQLAKEIKTYLEYTNDFEATELNTLFVTDWHYKKWDQSKHSNSRYLTYINLNTILKYFYRDVIQDIYKIKIVSSKENKHLREKEILRIHLGDTRHIALINLMQQGGTPIAAMLLAGHDNVNTASNYYSNVTSLIECKTYKQYRKVLCGEVKYQISKYTSVKSAVGTLLTDGGKCYSKAFAENDFSDCMDAIGPNSEIGYCPNCPNYRRNGLSFFSGGDIYKRHLQDDCAAIEQAVNLVRKGKGELETILEATLKLNASALSYEQYLMEKKAKEE